MSAPLPGARTDDPGAGVRDGTLVRKTLRPGQNGTRKLVADYGERLVCVRYRYDRHGGKRWKTVEIVVSEARWTPKKDLSARALVTIGLEPWEDALRSRLIRAGARWEPGLRSWRVRYDIAVTLGLGKRIRSSPPRQPDPKSV